MTNNKLFPVTVYVPVKGMPILGESYVAVIYGDITTSDWETVINPEKRFIFTKEELETLLMNCYNDAAWNEKDGKHAQKGQADVLISYIQSLF